MIAEYLAKGFAGAVMYRLRGSKLLDGHAAKVVLCAILAYPYAYAVALHGWPVWVAVCTELLTIGTLLAAHGNGQDLGTWVGTAKPEQWEFLVKFIPPGYWHDFAFLSITGLLVTLPAGILCLNPAMALAGALKPVGYAIGWALKKYVVPTQIGECFTGFILWAFVPTHSN